MEVIARDGAVTSEDSVVVDGNVTTSRGLGTAVDFALSLISQLENEEKAEEIAESVVYDTLKYAKSLILCEKTLALLDFLCYTATMTVNI